MAPARERKTSPTWSDVKGKLAEFDRTGLLGRKVAKSTAQRNALLTSPKSTHNGKLAA
jgi:hypothetical protein